MHYSYCIDVEQRRMFEIYRGEIDVTAIKQSRLRLAGDAQFDPNYDLVIDFYHCDLKISPQDLRDLKQFHFEIFGFSHGKTVFLVDTPKVTALTVLFQKNMRCDREMKVFSSKEAAKKWLASSRNIQFSLV